MILRALSFILLISIFSCGVKTPPKPLNEEKGGEFEIAKIQSFYREDKAVIFWEVDGSSDNLNFIIKIDDSIRCSVCENGIEEIRLNDSGRIISTSPDEVSRKVSYKVARKKYLLNLNNLSFLKNNQVFEVWKDDELQESLKVPSLIKTPHVPRPFLQKEEGILNDDKVIKFSWKKELEFIQVTNQNLIESKKKYFKVNIYEQFSDFPINSKPIIESYFVIKTSERNMKKFFIRYVDRYGNESAKSNIISLL